MGKPIGPMECDKEILDILKKSDRKHIDYLVDVLTDRGNGRVALSSSVKDLLISEKNENYSENGLRHLIREFQDYGGHLLLNGLRKNPLSYSEILTDVHKKLNGKNSKKKSAEEKEREIVLSLFGKEWKSLEDKERWERCTNFKVIAGFFNMHKNLNFDEKNIGIGSLVTIGTAFLIKNKWHPVAIGVNTIALLNQGMSEAYRITIPFVAHIAMLKMLHSSSHK